MQKYITFKEYTKNFNQSNRQTILDFLEINETVKTRFQAKQNVSYISKKQMKLLKQDQDFVNAVFEVASDLREDITFEQRLMCIRKNYDSTKLKCVICGNPVSYSSSGKFLTRTCSPKCTNIFSHSEESLEKKRKSYFAKTGYVHQSQNPEIKERKKKAALEKYGVECHLQAKCIKDDIKKTNLEKYGVENPSQLPETIEKIKKTNLEKYGYENASQNPEIIEKIQQTLFLRYGGAPAGNTEIQERMKQTNLQRYGVENPYQNKMVREKARQTSLKEYGYENPAQNPNIKRKISKGSFKIKEFVLENQEIWYCQGYEPKALEILQKQGYNLSKDISKISFQYIDNGGKRRFHLPDIYIEKENRIIEVKSSWTIKKEADQNFIKQKSAKKLGYNYEYWVLSRNGEIEKILS